LHDTGPIRLIICDPVDVLFVIVFLRRFIFMKTKTKDLSLAWQISMLVMLCTVIVMMPDFAFAQSNLPMGNVLCTASSWFVGNTGKGLATIAITVIGIGALLGKVSWGMAMIVGTGVAIVFGAAGIVNSMGGGPTGITETNMAAGTC
jgi:type IV secretory pathway VirB2 component (pilin)